MKEISGTLKNLTPHDVTLMGEDGYRYVVTPEPEPARVGEKRAMLGVISSAKIRVTLYRKAWDRANATGIPLRSPGVFFIVSTVIAEAFPERDDFLVPDLVQRDGNAIVGCLALAQMWPASNQVAKEYLERARDYATVPPERTQTEE